MTKHERISLRTRLRSDTRATHDDLDRHVSLFDLTTQPGFLNFIQMQCAAMRSIAPHAKNARSLHALNDLMQRAESDLRTFAPTDRTRALQMRPVHPLAIDYVVAGSRLGTQVLKKRWLAANDPDVRRADAYFTAPSYIEVWKAFCETSEAMAPNGPLAEQITQDVDLIFQVYQECARSPIHERGTQCPS